MKGIAWPRFGLATTVLAIIFALSTALLVGILTAESSAETVTPGVPPPSWVPYTVQPGDTLRELARSRGVSVAVVRRANGLASQDLTVGQVVYLPPLSTASTPRPALFDAGTLTAAGAFVTSVGSLVGVVLTYLRSRREMELADQRHKREIELETAKLELEQLRLEEQRRTEADDSVGTPVE